MEKDQIASHETARQKIYKALARCFQQPDETLFDTMSCLKDNLGSIESGVLSQAERIVSGSALDDLDFLKVDFARLFVGPYTLLAPPYGSVYLEQERKVMGDSTLDALNRYRKFKLDMTGSIKEVPDHISVELEFMFFLIYKETESILSNDPEAAQFYFHEQACFLTDHLSGWIPEFAHKIIAFSETDFYSGVGKIIQRFIEDDLHFVKSVIKKAAIS